MLVSLYIAGSADYYVDLDETNLYLQAKILDSEGKAPKRVVSDTDATVPPSSVVFPVNNFISSAFKQVEVFLNDKPVETVHLYPYRYDSVIITSR